MNKNAGGIVMGRMCNITRTKSKDRTAIDITIH